MLIMVEQEFDLDDDGGLDEEEFMGLYNQVLDSVVQRPVGLQWPDSVVMLQLMMDCLDWEDLAAQISDAVLPCLCIGLHL